MKSNILIGSRFDLPYFKNPTLMGPWCLPLPSDSFYNDSYSVEMLEAPWKTEEEIAKAYQTAEIAYKKSSVILAEILNSIHCCNRSVRSWEIVIGPWLKFLINALFDKYERLLQAQEMGIDTFVGLAASEEVIANDTTDFVICINHKDSFNLQISTCLARMMGFHIIESKEEKLKTSEKKLKTSFEDLLGLKVSKKGWKLKAFEKIQQLFYPYADVILYGSYHSPFFTKKLFLKSWFKIVDFPGHSYEKITYSEDQGKRNELKTNLNQICKKTNGFEHLLLKAIPTFMPLCFLDDFIHLKKLTSERFGKKNPRKIVSAQRWYFDELFKLWAANSAEKGCKLIGLQHGGNYGVVEHLSCEDHEISIVDQFLTWGWKIKSCKRILPSPAQKFIISSVIPTNLNQPQDILYVATSPSRFLIEISQQSDYFAIYFNEMVQFLGTLPAALQEKIRIRLHSEDNIWEIRKRIIKKFPSIRFDNLHHSYPESLANCKMVVCDHLSTTYLEDFSANKPTILFWNKQTTILKPIHKHFFQNLEEVGILHTGGKEAADFCSTHYRHIGTWWKSKEVQEIRNVFCKNFARLSSNPTKEWLGILLGAIAEEESCKMIKT